MNTPFIIEAFKSFETSLIWDLNREYYKKNGVEVWRDGTVPHYATSNSKIGYIYAELIYSFLQDLAKKGQMDKVYILELGAGHGRLAFHILKHLERLQSIAHIELPSFCYVMSDIVEANLDFFYHHPQFQTYYQQGILDLAYFDALKSRELRLRISKTVIKTQSLAQPLVVIANYFFDSIPCDLFQFSGDEISECEVSLVSEVDPSGMDEMTLLENIDLVYKSNVIHFPYYNDSVLDEILADYSKELTNTYLLFPHLGIRCIKNLQQLSGEGVMLISMDKGFHEIHDLENGVAPKMITHGSMSFSVNYHALLKFCQKMKGRAMFPTYSTFHLEIGCMLFLEDCSNFSHLELAFRRFVDDFGPDDFHSCKTLMYKNLAQLDLPEIISMLRLGAYDSTLFINVLPRIKENALRLSHNERFRLAQTMHKTWDSYFSISEPFDLAFEIGGLFYALGYYKEALQYFKFSIQLFGPINDVYYNLALCYYQLRADDLFVQTLNDAKTLFPSFDKLAYLESLDLNAK